MAAGEVETVAYVREKKVPGKRGKVYSYYQLVEGYRDPETGKARQRVLKHLGRFDSIEDARASLVHDQATFRGTERCS
jgi:hypothetical protein